MFLEIWNFATGSFTSAFSLGTASKVALFLLGSGVLALGVGSMLSGSARVFHVVKHRALGLSDDEEEEDSDHHVESRELTHESESEEQPTNDEEELVAENENTNAGKSENENDPVVNEE